MAETPLKLTGAQIRAARALLDWSQSDLAARTGLSIVGIKKLESDGHVARKSTLLAVESVFNTMGVIFLDSRGVSFDKD
jgi:transcriptional regulator with XRE-family HTH domain